MLRAGGMGVFSCSSDTLNSLFYSIPLLLDYLSVNPKWLLHWIFSPSLGLIRLFIYPHLAALQLLSDCFPGNEPCGGELETFLLLHLTPALCLAMDSPKGQGPATPCILASLSYTFLVPTPNCLTDSQGTKAKEILRRGMREIISQIKWWSSFSFSFLNLLPSSPL